MKEEMMKCWFCKKLIPASKAWPIVRRDEGEIRITSLDWACKKHPGVDDEIRRQLMARELVANCNPANPDFVALAQLACVQNKKE